MDSNTPQRRNAPLKTYSRRVPSTTSQNTKKRTIDEISTSPTTQILIETVSKEVEVFEEPVLPKLYKKSSIQNYFRPVQVATPCTSSESVREPSSDLREVMRDGTPPSSPPPLLYGHGKRKEGGEEGLVEPKKKSRRRLNARPYLAPIVNCAETTALESKEESEPTTTPVTATRKKVSKMTQQARLDMNLPTFLECKMCKMQYNKTEQSDRDAHAAYHDEFVNGKKKKSKHTSSTNVVYSAILPSTFKGGENEKHEITMIDRNSSMEARVQAREALDLSYADMDGIRYPDEELWSDCSISESSTSSATKKTPRYKILIYHVSSFIAGVALVENITHAKPFPTTSIDEITREEHLVPADLCIERIWIKETRRNQGLATRMVDIARDVFVDGKVISKTRVAFSAPTRAGRSFAKEYCRGIWEEWEFLVTL